MMLQKKGKTSLVKTVVQITCGLSLFLAAAVSAQSVSKKPANANADKKPAATRVQYDTIQAKNVHNTNGVYNYVEKMPEASYSISKFLAENLKYPESARKQGIQGRVIIKFIVDENGNISNPVVLRGKDKSLDDEALRAVSKMPAWKPGEQNGRKVPVYFTLPVLFKLEDDSPAPAKTADVTVSPNPAEGSFNIKGATGSGKDEQVSITIADMKGNVVYSRYTTSHNGALNEQIQLSNTLANGMYMVTVHSVSFNKVLHTLIKR